MAERVFSCLALELRARAFSGIGEIVFAWAAARARLGSFRHEVSHQSCCHRRCRPNRLLPPFPHRLGLHVRPRPAGRVLAPHRNPAGPRRAPGRRDGAGRLRLSAAASDHPHRRSRRRLPRRELGAARRLRARASRAWSARTCSASTARSSPGQGQAIAKNAASRRARARGRQSVQHQLPHRHEQREGHPGRPLVCHDPPRRKPRQDPAREQARRPPTGAQVTNLAIWGNHSATLYPDFANARSMAPGHRGRSQTAPGSKASSSPPCSSAAPPSSRPAALPPPPPPPMPSSIPCRSLTKPTRERRLAQRGDLSDGSYGIEKGLITSFPVRSDGKKLEIVQGLRSRFQQSEDRSDDQRVERRALPGERADPQLANIRERRRDLATRVAARHTGSRLSPQPDLAVDPACLWTGRTLPFRHPVVWKLPAGFALAYGCFDFVVLTSVRWRGGRAWPPLVEWSGTIAIPDISWTSALPVAEQLAGTWNCLVSVFRFPSSLPCS